MTLLYPFVTIEAKLSRWGESMGETKFSYVQIGAKDYQALADFYVKALGFIACEDKSWLQGQEGVCLTAPGFAQGQAPIFGFVPATEGEVAKINDVGFAHTCFETNDVKAAVKQLLKYGGSIHSTMDKPEIHPCVYCKDPEGNVVEFHIPFPSEKSFGEIVNTASCLLGLKPEKKLRKDSDARGALKFIHVNIICADWEKLCGFYRDTFACVNVGKIKNHQGDYKEKVIGVPEVHVVGQHVLLPGFAKDYPTLEIFTYSVKGRKQPCDEKSLGINCLGFVCEDLEAAASKLVANGGTIKEKGVKYILVGDSQNDMIILR